MRLKCLRVVNPVESSQWFKKKKRAVPHPSRVAVRRCDNQTVLVGGLSVQRLSKQEEANPAERGVREDILILHMNKYNH